MRQIDSKSGLAIILSAIKGFSEPEAQQEQHLTDSEIGASVVWSARLLGDIKGKVIADLGCGTGVLGIGALLLGAKLVFFVDSDDKALETAKSNISKLRSEDFTFGKFRFIHKDIKYLDIKTEVVVQNPPFGTKIRHNDILFLKKALKIAPVVYSFHKSETKAFLIRFSQGQNAEITHIWDFKYPLKSSFAYHRRKIYYINVSCLRFEKLNY